MSQVSLQVELEEKDCSICSSHYTKAKRIPITCKFCSFTCCSDCLRKYLLTKADAHCVNPECKKQFSKDWLYQNFSRSFVNDKLMNHYADVAFDLEKSLLEETAVYIEAHKQDEVIRRKEQQINNIQNELEQLTRWRTNNQTLFNNTEDKTPLSNFFRTFLDTIDSSMFTGIKSVVTQFILTLPRTTTRHQIHLVVDYIAKKCETYIEGLIASSDELKQKHLLKTSTRCFTPHCAGFLGNKEEMKEYVKGKCLVCSTAYCCDCAHKFSEQKEEHKCDPNTVKSLKLIARETKPCPNCKEAIFKINGCDQMFCTRCYTAFDWRSNTVIAGQIHNPHYTEYLAEQHAKQAKQARQAKPTIHTGQLTEEQKRYSYFFTRNGFDISFIPAVVDRPNRTTYEKNIIRFLYEFWDHCSHCTINELTAYRLQPVVERYRYLRIRFLEGRLHEDTWKTDLTASYKKDEILKMKFDLLEAFLHRAAAIFVDITHAQRAQKKLSIPNLIPIFEEGRQQILQVCQWFNEKSKAISDYLGHKTYPKMIFDLRQISHDKSDSSYFSLQSGQNTKNELAVEFGSVSEIDEKKVELMDSEVDMKHRYDHIKALVDGIEGHLTKVQIIGKEHNSYSDKCVHSFLEYLTPTVIHDICERLVSIFTCNEFQHSSQKFFEYLAEAKAKKQRTTLIEQYVMEMESLVKNVSKKASLLLMVYMTCHNSIYCIVSHKQQNEVCDKAMKLIMEAKAKVHSVYLELDGEFDKIMKTIEAKKIEMNSTNSYVPPVIREHLFTEREILGFRLSFPKYFALLFDPTNTRVFKQILKSRACGLYDCAFMKHMMYCSYASILYGSDIVSPLDLLWLVWMEAFGKIKDKQQVRQYWNDLQEMDSLVSKSMIHMIDIDSMLTSYNVIGRNELEVLDEHVGYVPHPIHSLINKTILSVLKKTLQSHNMKIVATTESFKEYLSQKNNIQCLQWFVPSTQGSSGNYIGCKNDNRMLNRLKN